MFLFLVPLYLIVAWSKSQLKKEIIFIDDKPHMVICYQLLGRWIPNPEVPDSKSLGGSKVDSAFHPFVVDQIFSFFTVFCLYYFITLYFLSH